jgi:hypothetical protein
LLRAYLTVDAGEDEETSGEEDDPDANSCPMELECQGEDTTVLTRRLGEVITAVEKLKLEGE